ncbi:MAG: NAD(P)-dependent oxidoreductase [Kiritimatiellae bacterium]|nr:NAD(P)-dependent oxidoreductase [Kiritimatiellia bacterium]
MRSLMKLDVIAVFQESKVPCFCARKRHVARLRREFPVAEVRWCRTRQTFERVLPRVQAAVTWAFRQEWFELAPNLRRIATPAAGRDFFPLDPPARVKVMRGTHHGPVMAETVLGLMLAVNRGLFDAYACQMRGEIWPCDSLHGIRLLAGTHAVIVGFGNIGQHIGRMLKGFGVRVTGVRRNVPQRPPEWFDRGDAVVSASRMDGALRRADHVIAVLPSDTGTDKIFDARRLELMPRHAVFYNVGRGNCVDEKALAKALKLRRLRGACLDVFAREPLERRSPLADNLPGLIRLPHSSAFTDDYIDRFLEEAVAWLKK